MSDTAERVNAILESNDEMVENEGQEIDHGGQSPGIGQVQCGDSRIHPQELFLVEEPGESFTVRRIGGRVTDEMTEGTRQAYQDFFGKDPETVKTVTYETSEGEKEVEHVLNGDLMYSVAGTESGTIVAGVHDVCGAIGAAYAKATGEMMDREELEHKLERPGLFQAVNIIEDDVAEIVDSIRDSGRDLDTAEEYQWVIEEYGNRMVELLLEDSLVEERVENGEMDVAGLNTSFGSPEHLLDRDGEVYLFNLNGRRAYQLQENRHQVYEANPDRVDSILDEDYSQMRNSF